MIAIKEDVDRRILPLYNSQGCLLATREKAASRLFSRLRSVGLVSATELPEVYDSNHERSISLSLDRADSPGHFVSLSVMGPLFCVSAPDGLGPLESLELPPAQHFELERVLGLLDKDVAFLPRSLLAMLSPVPAFEHSPEEDAYLSYHSVLIDRIDYWRD